MTNSSEKKRQTGQVFDGVGQVVDAVEKAHNWIQNCFDLLEVFVVVEQDQVADQFQHLYVA